MAKRKTPNYSSSIPAEQLFISSNCIGNIRVTLPAKEPIIAFTANNALVEILDIGDGTITIKVSNK